MVKLSTGGCIPLPSPSSSSPDSPVPVPGGLLVRHCKCSGSTRTPPAPAHHTTVTWHSHESHMITIEPHPPGFVTCSIEKSTIALWMFLVYECMYDCWVGILIIHVVIMQVTKTIDNRAFPALLSMQKLRQKIWARDYLNILISHVDVVTFPGCCPVTWIK